MRSPDSSSPPKAAPTRDAARRAALARLVGARGRADVQRALGEWLARRPVIVRDDDDRARIVLPVDGLDAAALAALCDAADAPPRLVVSPTRAAALGVPGAGVASFALPAGITPAALLELAGAAGACAPGEPTPGDAIDAAAVELAKLGRLLPALVCADAAGLDARAELVAVRAADVLAYRAGVADGLRRVSSAPVPMRAASDCELQVFRDERGEEWSMIVVGRPDRSRPVPVRLHSACLTGDAFASLRCDCGDQLQMALAKMADLGGGALLYLTQEGCGLGLANKMRAYRLQDDGLDTVDANTTLGFETDERRYTIAARMLRAAGIDQVAVLTNNPRKLEALRAAGLDVRERIPLLAPVGPRNSRYLDTKRRRAGHMIGEPGGWVAGD
jgi:GTP cyclohydrolase II